MFIKEVNENRGLDFKQEIRDYIVGQSVVTKYNKKVYKVQDVAFNMNPSNCFEYKGTKISFASYLDAKYHFVVTQPV